jgi:hypothetical protein
MGKVGPSSPLLIPRASINGGIGSPAPQGGPAV